MVLETQQCRIYLQPLLKMSPFARADGNDPSVDKEAF
jgi:hypothetical protein